MFRYEHPIYTKGSKVMITSAKEIKGFMNIEVFYMGFTSTISELLKNGWEMHEKLPYTNWHDTVNSKKASHYMFFHNKKQGMLAKLKLKINADTLSLPEGGELEYMTIQKYHRIKPPKYTEKRDYTEDDIAPMLEAISAIQAKRPRKRKETPTADILEFVMQQVG